MPLVRAGLGAAPVSSALAAATISITIMRVIDNLTLVLIPSAMEAGLGDPLFYGSIAAGFALAYPFAARRPMRPDPGEAASDAAPLR